MDEWTPEPLAAPLTPEEQADLASIPVIIGPTGPKPKIAPNKTVINLASYNFTGLIGNEAIKASAIETVRKYGLGSCGPPGFYGTQGECPASSSSGLVPSTARELASQTSLLSVLSHGISTGNTTSCDIRLGLRCSD